MHSRTENDSRRTLECRQRGSAYIVALLALVVLSLIGLTLSLITQTEMVMGSNERTLTKILYDADTALSESTARLLHNDCAKKEFVLPDPGTSPVGSTLSAEGIRPIGWATPPYTQKNANRPAPLIITYTMAASARRGNATTTLAEKRLTTIVEIYPRDEEDIAKCWDPKDDEACIKGAECPPT